MRNGQLTSGRKSHLWERRRCLNRQRAVWLVRVNQTCGSSGRLSSPHSHRGPADPHCSHLRRTLFPELQGYRNKKLKFQHASNLNETHRTQILTCADESVVSSTGHKVNFLRFQSWNYTKENVINKSTFIIINESLLFWAGKFHHHSSEDGVNMQFKDFSSMLA